MISSSGMQQWPFPPFFRDGRPADAMMQAEAILFTTTGETRYGVLERFEPDAQLLTLALNNGQGTLDLHFSTIKSIQLMPPIPLTADAELTALYRAAGGHEVSTASRPFTVHFADGESLRGDTKGFVKSRHGLFFFLTTDSSHCVRIFIPTTALQSYQVGGLLGQHLIRSRLVSADTVQQALNEQERRRHQAPRGTAATVPIRDLQQLKAEVAQIDSFVPMRLGDILVHQGMVTDDQMRQALGLMQRDKRHLLGDILVEMGALSRTQLTDVVAEQFSVPRVALDGFVIQPEVLRLVPKDYAAEHQMLPLLVSDKSLVVAVESPLDADYIDELRMSVQKQVVPVVANPEELAKRISFEYSRVGMNSSDLSIEEEIQQLSLRLSADDTARGRGELQKQVSDNDSLVVRLVNKTILDAQLRGASDIHIEAYPEEQPTLIRLRVDGDLTEYMRIPFVLRAALLSRIKIMANLDISEHRLPQDGKIDFSRFGHTKLELRVAVLPTTNGLEDIVMRLLASSKPIALAKLGMDAPLVEQLQKMVHRSYGLLLVCGPTGSGKTTTLHSLLAEVNHPDTKIWTAEDPIEITHQGLRQIQMHPRIGLTFATAMRAFLRADPDVIMVGEMRDSETAHIAIEASLTGHMVMSTLHTNSAPESVIRMLDMGLDPFNFADALVGVLSQRLARRLCPDCKQPYTPGHDELNQMASDYAAGTRLDPDQVRSDWQHRFVTAGKPDGVLYKAQGCSHCDHTGYKGRVGIYELMAASPEIKKLIQTRAPVDQLFETATAQGMLRLLQYGFLKVLEGVTDQRSVRGACS